MTEPRLVRRRRNLPHRTLEGSVYFVTFRTAGQELSEEERSIILGHLRSSDEVYYQLLAAVVMPDHVHLLLKPLRSYSLSRILKGIKGVTARKINLRRRANGSLWQDESFDRIVRDFAEFEEKLNYMANNPVKAGLVSRIEDYAFWFCRTDLL